MSCEDCDTINANVSYYEAAVTVDQAAVTVAQNQLSADQTGYYYWLGQQYECGCGPASSAPEAMPKPEGLWSGEYPTLEELQAIEAALESAKKEYADAVAALSVTPVSEGVSSAGPSAIEDASNQIASNGVGVIDPISIIAIVTQILPMIIQCFQKQKPGATAADAKSFVASNYDASTDTFDQQLINRTRPRTRRAALRTGHRHLSRSEVDDITVATFKHAMNAPDDVVGACLDEAAAMPPQE